MPDEPKLTCRYRILRYMPNLIRDEWVNIGVLLEQMDSSVAGAVSRLGGRLIEEDADIARIRRLHGGVDERVLRALPAQFDDLLRSPVAAASEYLQKLDTILSNSIQFGPYKGLLADDFDAELDRLFRDQVAPPASGRATLLRNAREWIRSRVRDIFRRRLVLGKLQSGIPVAEFTQPGDPLRLDYGYRINGTRGFIHALSLAGDPVRAKVLAYTASCIRAKAVHAEFTAMTEAEPEVSNRRHQFVVGLFQQQGIAIVPLQRAEAFAEDLRIRIQ